MDHSLIFSDMSQVTDQWSCDMSQAIADGYNMKAIATTISELGPTWPGGRYLLSSHRPGIVEDIQIYGNDTKKFKQWTYPANAKLFLWDRQTHCVTKWDK